MNPLTQIKNQQLATAREIQRGISESASWHAQYKHSAYIFVGGLAYELTEGDVLAVFAQYGEIVDVNLVRDKETGKSKGFAFVAYEDQRSTVLSVDNLSGAKVAGRTVRVQHVENYKKKRKEVEGDDGEDDGNEQVDAPPSQHPGVAAGERWPNDKYQEKEQRQAIGGMSGPAEPWAGPGSVFALLRDGAPNQPVAAREDPRKHKEKKEKNKKDKEKKKKRKHDQDSSPPSSPSPSPGPPVPRPPAFGPPRPSLGHASSKPPPGPPRSFGPPRPGEKALTRSHDVYSPGDNEMERRGAEPGDLSGRPNRDSGRPGNGERYNQSRAQQGWDERDGERGKRARYDELPDPNKSRGAGSGHERGSEGYERGARREHEQHGHGGYGKEGMEYPTSSRHGYEREERLRRDDGAYHERAGRDGDLHNSSSQRGRDVRQGGGSHGQGDAGDGPGIRPRGEREQGSYWERDDGGYRAEGRSARPGR